MPTATSECQVRLEWRQSAVQAATGQAESLEMRGIRGCIRVYHGQGNKGGALYIVLALQFALAATWYNHYTCNLQKFGKVRLQGMHPEYPAYVIPIRCYVPATRVRGLI